MRWRMCRSSTWGPHPSQTGMPGLLCAEQNRMERPTGARDSAHAGNDRCRDLESHGDAQLDAIAAVVFGPVQSVVGLREQFFEFRRGLARESGNAEARRHLDGCAVEYEFLRGQLLAD